MTITFDAFTMNIIASGYVVFYHEFCNGHNGLPGWLTRGIRPQRGEHFDLGWRLQ